MSTIQIDGVKIELKEEKLGIAGLREIVRFAGKLRRKIADITKDGRFSFWEKLSVLALLGDVAIIAPFAQQAFEELNDLDEAEYRELVAFALLEGLGGNSKEAEAFVRDQVYELLQAVAAITAVIKKW